MEKGAVRLRGPTAPTLLSACAHQDKAVNARSSSQVASALAVVVGAFIARLLGGQIVQDFLLGLACLGLAFARAHVGEGCLVLQRLELLAGAPAHRHVLYQGGGELLGIGGRLCLQTHVEGTQVAQVHTVAQEQLLADAIHQLGGNGYDVALVVLTAMAGHVLCHVVHVQVLRILRSREGLVALLGFAGLYLAKDKRIRYAHNNRMHPQTPSAFQASPPLWGEGLARCFLHAGRGWWDFVKGLID